MKTEDTKTTALINLLQDDNQRIASMAMEQLLKHETMLDETIAEYQESEDPRLRQRLHQLSSILARRRYQRDLVAALRDKSITLWQGICRLNQLYDPNCSQSQITDMVNSLAEESDRALSNSSRLASFMKEADFTVPLHIPLDIDVYLIESVLDFRMGSSAVLCALAQNLAWMNGNLSTNIVLYEARFCLTDNSHHLIDPAAWWRVSKLEDTKDIHPCSRQDVWLGILSQMFLIAVTDGNLYDTHYLSKLLTELNGDPLSSLPHPLGDKESTLQNR